MLDPWPIRRTVTRRKVRPGSGEKVVVYVDDWHALFAGVNRAAILAFAPIFIAVELIEERWQILDNAFQLNFGAIEQLVALRTKPLEGIQGGPNVPALARVA